MQISIVLVLPLLSALPAKPRTMASWSCTKCTFLNPPSQKSACQICLSPSPTPPSSSSAAAGGAAAAALQWSCRACTFANPSGSRACEICGTRAVPFCVMDDDLGLDEEDMSDPSIGSVFWPLQRCNTNSSSSKRPADGDAAEAAWPEKMPRKEAASENSGFHSLRQCSSSRAPMDDAVECLMENMPMEATSVVTGNLTLKILSYNVWFREDLEVHKRMKALGDLIEQHTPDIICFQEVTPNIYEIFKRSTWWKAYTCSVSNKLATERAYFCMQMSKLLVKEFTCKQFSNTIMGRELCLAVVDAGMGKKLVVATSHLESPCPAPPRWDQMFSKERVTQAKESVNLLKGSHNAIFCGDMNWDDKLDGAFPLPGGWLDAWKELRPAEEGWTYDTKANQMLSGNRKLQKRLDRFVCNLRDFKVSRIQMIGTEAIPGLSYCKEKKVKNEIQKIMLPVLPSDHYGLLLTICSS